MHRGEAFGLPPAFDLPAALGRSRCPDCGAPTHQGQAAALLPFAVGDTRAELLRVINATDGAGLDAWVCRRASCGMFGVFSPWIRG